MEIIKRERWVSIIITKQGSNHQTGIFTGPVKEHLCKIDNKSFILFVSLLDSFTHAGAYDIFMANVISKATNV